MRLDVSTRVPTEVIVFGLTVESTVLKLKLKFKLMSGDIFV
jgi:hypothetical protein